MFIGSASSFCPLNFINLFQSLKNEIKKIPTLKTVKLLQDFASFHYQQNKANFLQLSALRYKALVWITFLRAIMIVHRQNKFSKISAYESPKKHSLGKNLELFVCSIL